MITRLASVPVFVSDQDQALKFYRDRLGFEVVVDVPYSPYDTQFRWLALAPRKGGTQIILFHPAMANGDSEDLRQRCGIWTAMVFATEDIRATYHALRERGVVFEAEPSQQSWGGWETWFSDPDGNRFHLVQENEYTRP